MPYTNIVANVSCRLVITYFISAADPCRLLASSAVESTRELHPIGVVVCSVSNKHSGIATGDCEGVWIPTSWEIHT